MTFAVAPAPDVGRRSGFIFRRPELLLHRRPDSCYRAGYATLPSAAQRRPCRSRRAVVRDTGFEPYRRHAASAPVDEVIVTAGNRGPRENAALPPSYAPLSCKRLVGKARHLGPTRSTDRRCLPANEFNPPSFDFLRCECAQPDGIALLALCLSGNVPRNLAPSHSARRRSGRDLALEFGTGKAPEFLVQLLIESTNRAGAKTARKAPR